MENWQLKSPSLQILCFFLHRNRGWANGPHQTLKDHFMNWHLIYIFSDEMPNFNICAQNRKAVQSKFEE